MKLEDFKLIRENFQKFLNEEGNKIKATKPISGITNFYGNDIKKILNPDNGGIYQRVYNNHTTTSFTSHWNDGTEIESFQKEHDEFINYLKQLNIPYKETTSVSVGIAYQYEPHIEGDWKKTKIPGSRKEYNVTTIGVLIPNKYIEFDK